MIAADVEIKEKVSGVRRASQAAGTFFAVVLASIATAALTSFVFLSYLVPEAPDEQGGQTLAPVTGSERPSTDSTNSRPSEAAPQSSSGHEARVIEVVMQAEPSVVSVVATKDLPVIERYYVDPFDGDSPLDDFFNFRVPQYRESGTEPKEVAAGTGFIVSADGLVVTNRHVVDIEEAEFTIIFGDGERLDAEVIAIDPVEDLAVLRVDRDGLQALPLGDSSSLKIGQSVIAIGNALGEFQNTVSVGVVSGLRRRIVAGSGGSTTVIEDAIQTDAAINRGNSGGPLLNLNGEVIGINTAIVIGSENLGFAIPINKVRKAIEDVETLGYISRPFIGVRFVMVDREIQDARGLPNQYGALILGSGDGRDPGVLPDSPADEAGLREGDVILTVNGELVDDENPLSQVVVRHSVGDTVTLRVYSEGIEREVTLTLVERPNE